MSSTETDDLDTPIFGAFNIAKEANLRDKDGKISARKAYNAAEKGYLPVRRFGRLLVSSKRQLRSITSGK